MSDQPASLAAAILAVQAELDPIAKQAEGQVGTRRYKYASYKAIMAVVFPLLLKYGLVWNSRPTMIDGQFVLAYRLRHLGSDEEDTGLYPLPNSTPQTMGGAITYAKRYAIGAVLDIVLTDDDDDAAGAEHEASARKVSGHDSDAKRAAEGRMTRGQQRDHDRLVAETRATGRAERHRGRDDADPWQTPEPRAVEDARGSISDKQRSKMMMLFAKAGINAREDRLAYAMSKLDLTELATSNDLSMRQAGQLIAYLESEPSFAYLESEPS